MNHEGMLIIEADRETFFRTEKGKVLLFPNNIILNQKHNTYFSLISLINENYVSNQNLHAR